MALALYALYLALAFGLRTLLQLRRTGHTGWRGLSGRRGSLEWWAGVLFALAFVGGVAAPLAAMAGLLAPVPTLDRPLLHGLGVALFAVGLLGTLAAQLAMGDSWRIGVDAAETTSLVTHGPFALVRNPIFAAMVPAGLGLVLLVPSVLAIVSWVALVMALELQTRLVEEPYLARVHGERYAAYAARVGRFLPYLGRLRR